jgi:hypothetical protein
LPSSSRNRKRAATGILAVLLLGTVSCRDGKEPASAQPDGSPIEVNIAVSLCRPGGTGCISVRVPDVDVTVAPPGGFTETKKTDANGVATFARTVAGTGTITAHSAILSGDIVEDVTTSRGADRAVVALADPKPILVDR